MLLRRQAAGLLLGVLWLLAAPPQGEAESAKQRILLNGFVQETFDTPKPAQPKLDKSALAPGGPGIVGVDLLIRPGDFPLVKQVFQDSPAARAGLTPGDTIITVDGVTTLNKTLPEVDEQISNVPGTPVVFQILRNGYVKQCRVVVAALSAIPQHIRPVYDAVPGLQNGQ